MQKLTSFDITRLIIQSGLFSAVSMSMPAQKVLLSIATHFNNKLRYAYPAQSTIAYECGLDRVQVCKAVKELKKIGLIEIPKGSSGRTLTYSFSALLFSIITANVKENKVCQLDTTDVSVRHMNMSQTDTQTNIITNIEQTNFLNNFNYENLSASEKKIYNNLPRFEKNNWLNAKKADYFKSFESKILHKKLQNDRLNSCPPTDENYLNWRKLKPQLIK